MFAFVRSTVWLEDCIGSSDVLAMFKLLLFLRRKLDFFVVVAFGFPFFVFLRLSFSRFCKFKLVQSGAVRHSCNVVQDWTGLASRISGEQIVRGISLIFRPIPMYDVLV